MAFDHTHTPCTQFEKRLSDLLDVCSRVSKTIPKTSPENKVVKDGIIYYSTAFKSTVEKSGKCHELNLPAFAALVKELPDSLDDLVNLEWLTNPKTDLVLRFIRISDGEYAPKVSLNLTAIYNFATEDIDQYQILFTFLRCCEVAETTIAKQAAIGRAAQEFESTFDTLEDELRDQEMGDDTDDGFTSGLAELKKRVINPKIWKTLLAEGGDMLKAAQEQPQLVQTFEGLMSEETTASEKFNLVKQLGENLPSSLSVEASGQS